MRSEWLHGGFLIIFIALLLCGCVQIDIGDDKVSPTIGAELIDLQRAYREGLISREELDELKRSLLELPLG